MPDQLTIRCPAKLNLALSVDRPSPSSAGMHPICSWMVTVDLCDELTITRLPTGRLSRYATLWHEGARRPSDIDWSVTKDLAVRAHLAMEEHIGRQLAIQSKLVKRIPVGSGLGGGSSDAAAMLRGLNEMFQLDLSSDELVSIGASIGADIGFLVEGGSAVVEGYGEQVTHQHSVPELHAAIALPHARCSTQEVYGVFDEIAPDDHEFRPALVRELARRAEAVDRDRLFNDLAASACRVAPSLQRDLQQLSDIAGLPAHMTGSGSSLFVICDDPLHASALADAVERQLDMPALPIRSITIDDAMHASR